jgi:hypothetical protein
MASRKARHRHGGPAYAILRSLERGFEREPGLKGAFILERDARQLPPKTFADKPGDPESSLIGAQARAMDIGDAVALGVAASTLWGKGDIGSKTVRCRKAGPLANQDRDHARLKQAADLIAQRHPRAGCDHDRREFNRTQSGNQTADQFDRMRMDRRRRKAIADHDRKIGWMMPAGFEQDS